MQVGAVANLKTLNTDCCRYFVFFAIAYLVLWESYTHLYLFYTHGLADRAYGLWPVTIRLDFDILFHVSTLSTLLYIDFLKFDLLFYLILLQKLEHSNSIVQRKN